VLTAQLERENYTCMVIFLVNMTLEEQKFYTCGTNNTWPSKV